MENTSCGDGQVRAADKATARGKTDFKAQRRVGEVLMKKSKVWMKPRETHSGKESVGGSRYYRTDASGRDRDGRQELG